MLNIPAAVIAFLTFLNNQQEDLSRAVARTAPQYLTVETARPHVVAAMAAATKKAPVELLLSFPFPESNYDPRATSHVFRGKRTTGVPKWDAPIKGVTGKYYCGVMQVAAYYSWERCLELRDLNEGYKAGAQVYLAFLKSCRGDKRCALLRYGGISKEKWGTATYPERVLSRAERIKKELNRVRKKRLATGV